MVFRRLICLFLLFLSQLSFGDTLIIEPDMGRTPIINTIKQTKHSLKLVMYGFTDQQLLASILQQKNQGKTVNIILEQSPYKADDENQKTQRALTENGITWIGKVPPYRLIHQKTLLIDENQALVMTFNFTQSSFKNERNFGLIIDDPARVKTIATIFSADWNHLPSATLNKNADIFISPDDSRQKLEALIQQARTSIQIYAQNINDYSVIGKLAQAAKRHVAVEIITSSKMRDKQEAYLTRAGVKIYQSTLMIHAKVVIIDHDKALLGSINLTRASLNDNREMSIVTYDRNVISQLEQVFNRDKQNTSLVSANTETNTATNTTKTNYSAKAFATNLSAATLPVIVTSIAQTARVIKHYYRRFSYSARPHHAHKKSKSPRTRKQSLS